MTEKQRHPKRERLFRVAGGDAPAPKKHLASCPSCRILVDLLRQIQADGEIPELVAPSEQHLASLLTIPARAKATQRRCLEGDLAFDSWRSVPATAVRDSALGSERRLTFRAGIIELELVAERQLTHWEFSARVYVDGIASDDVVLRVARHTITPQFQQLFHWSSNTPPRAIHVVSASSDIVFKIGNWTPERSR